MRPDPRNTLTGLRQRLDHRFTPPQRLGRDPYLALTPPQQIAYDNQRLAWFGAGFQVVTPDTMGLLRSVRSYLRTTSSYAVGERAVVLDGPANTGKTTMLLRLAREVEAATARMNPDYRDHGIVPVAYIEVAPKSTPKMIAAAILDFFATPFTPRATQRDLVARATQVMIARDTRLLLVDELQMLRAGRTHADDAIDTLKSIINNAGVVTVLSGIDLTGKLASPAAEQIMGRAEIRRLHPFSYANNTDRDTWAQLITAFAHEMRLTDTDPGQLLTLADPLHALTGGRIGTLRRVLARAMTAVLDEKPDPHAPETLTDQHLTGAPAPGPAAGRGDTAA